MFIRVFFKYSFEIKSFFFRNLILIVTLKKNIFLYVVLIRTGGNKTNLLGEYKKCIKYLIRNIMHQTAPPDSN